jgi:excisionase family DNA binding protein
MTNLTSGLKMQMEPLLTIEELASILKIHKNTIYKSLTGARLMPLPVAVKLGRFWRFRARDVSAFLMGLGGGGEEITAPVVQAEATIKRGQGRPRLLGGAAV